MLAVPLETYPSSGFFVFASSPPDADHLAGIFQTNGTPRCKILAKWFASGGDDMVFE